MKLTRNDVHLLKLIYLLAAGIVVCQALGQSGLTSLLFYMTFPVTVLLWIRTVRKTMTAMDLVMAATIMLACISVLLDAGIQNASLSFSYIRKLIIFSMTLLFLQTTYRMRADEEIVTFVNRVIDFLTVFLIVMFFFCGTRMYYIRGRLSNYLTFGVGNPNLTGMYLACMYMLELYRIFSEEKGFWKWIHVLMSVFLVFLAFETQSRNSILTMLLFTAVTLLLIFRGKKNLRISKTMAFFFAIFPALFLMLYMLLIYTPWMQEAFAFLVDEGKGLDSRMRIWGPAVQALKGSPLLGAYCDISNGTGISQMHNTHLDIAASYGVPVLILVCWLLRNYLYQHGRRYEDKQEYIYILGFACAIMLGIGEAGLFSGGLSLYIFVGTFLLFTDWKEDETMDDEI